MPPQQPEYYREPANQKHNPWIIPMAIVLSGALVGAGIYMSKRFTPVDTGTEASKNVIGDININPIGPSDHILGNPNAPVKIVEYTDTECPYCKTFHQTMQIIMNGYGKEGKVAWVIRHFPIEQLHKRAQKEAVATECANELGGQSKFWEYIDEVFARTNSNDSLDPAELPKIAKDIGLDEKDFAKCLTTTKYDNLILTQSQDAVRAGATGTPHSILIAPNGSKVAIKGSQPYDVMKAIIDAALEQTPINTAQN